MSVMLQSIRIKCGSWYREGTLLISILSFRHMWELVWTTTYVLAILIVGSRSLLSN